MNRRFERMMEIGIMGDIFILFFVIIILYLFQNFFPASKPVMLWIFTGVGLSFIRDLLKAIYWSRRDRFREYQENKNEKLILAKDERNIMIKEKAGLKIFNISLFSKLVLLIIIFFIKDLQIINIHWSLLALLLGFCIFEYLGYKIVISSLGERY